MIKQNIYLRKIAKQGIDVIEGPREHMQILLNIKHVEPKIIAMIPSCAFFAISVEKGPNSSRKSKYRMNDCDQIGTVVPLIQVKHILEEPDRPESLLHFSGIHERSDHGQMDNEEHGCPKHRRQHECNAACLPVKFRGHLAHSNLNLIHVNPECR